jgi:hypothetical protein
VITPEQRNAQVDSALHELHQAEIGRDEARVLVDHGRAQRRTFLRTFVTLATLAFIGIGVAIVDGTLVPVNTLAPLGEVNITVGLLGAAASAFGYVVTLYDPRTEKRLVALARHEATVRDRERRLLEVTS